MRHMGDDPSQTAQPVHSHDEAVDIWSEIPRGKEAAYRGCR